MGVRDMKLLVTVRRTEDGGVGSLIEVEDRKGDNSVHHSRRRSADSTARNFLLF